MSNSFNRVLSKMPKATAKKARLGKVKLSVVEDYRQAKLKFIEINEEVGYIFENLNKLKDQFKAIDSEWQNSFDEQKELHDSFRNSLSELGLEDEFSDIFMEDLEMTNLYHGQDRVWDSEGLDYLRK